jgi:hypothetical protein
LKKPGGQLSGRKEIDSSFTIYETYDAIINSRFNLNRYSGFAGLHLVKKLHSSASHDHPTPPHVLQTGYRFSILKNEIYHVTPVTA